MYKSLFLAMSLSFSLAACGAGNEQGPSPTATTAAHVQANTNEHSYMLSYQGVAGSVEGFGANSKEGAYDALAYMASNVWKPGSDAYRAMLSQDGLIVLMAEEDDKATPYKAVVKMLTDGLHIDVVAL